ncbi:MAG: uroporphyrinogen-III C-methyltransferase [Arachidicoccus sp.]|nr:uroporphyrinogen-III C-methyltransferase [Arachidicoccus sp.]
MNKGKIIFAGAGPGDPELITLKAYNYLREADVILYDRLVSDEILNTYANPRAEFVFVGKQGHCKSSVSQSKTNNLLLEYYHPEKLVVRLKGGDTAFYSNILDELITLTENNIPYEIVPGITAASGASAYAGIPLTARGYSDSVKFLTYCNRESRNENYWKLLADCNDTLVFYMTGEKLPELAENLRAASIDPNKKIAVIQQATTPLQQVSILSFNDLPQDYPKFISPVLIIVGKVVALHESFKWKENAASGVPYFKNLLLSKKIEEIYS